MSLLITIGVNAQSVPVGMDDAYRRAQLLGKLDSSISFTIRPISPSLAFKESLLNFDEPDSSLIVFGSEKRDFSFQNNKGNLALKMLPLSWQQQYNSTLPYGWNDGAMIPAKGYQTRISGGFFVKAGFLSIQVQPEYVYAANKKFENDKRLDDYLNASDLPKRFGEVPYSKLSWGQSNIMLNFGPVSLGLSNENLWWGPGMRNSLLMSNTGKGFKHLTIHTNRPVRTPIGFFEAQVIAGKLLGSGFSPLDSDPEFNDWRYLSSMAISYQPRWIPGLFLGLNRSFQAYSRDIKGFKGYFPFFTPFEKVKDNDNISGADKKDQVASVYARWLFPKAHAEVYAEFGTNDHAYNFRDLVMSPEHARAYIFGFRKLTPLKGRKDEYLQVNAEVTQTSQSIDRLVRDAYAWYVHFLIRQGYTHEGEVLGAGIGPGGNLQSIDLSWVKKQKLIGVQFERYVHNNDYYYAAIKDLDGQSRRWVDFGFAAFGTWDFKNLLINAKLQGIKSLNYQWQLENYAPNTYYIPKNDKLNFHAELGVMYRF